MSPSPRSAPRISIVTTSYNKVRHIEECLLSVLKQNCAGVEYIVVDAGSSDGSRDVINRFRERIQVVIEEPDRGPADGLNKGFAQATADIYGYLNADDRYVPGALQFVVDFFAAHPEVDVLTGAIRLIDEAGNPSVRKRTADAFDVADYAAGCCVIGQQATFFRRNAYDAAGGFNVANRIAWDGELLVDMALANQRYASVFKVLGDFRLYRDSITGSADYREKIERYYVDLRDQLAARGVKLHSPAVGRWRRWVHKWNPLRHLAYVLVS